MAPEENESEIRPHEEAKPMSTALLLLITPIASGFLLPFLFPIAKDWTWVEAWVFLILFMVFNVVMMLVLNKKNPQVLRSRMKHKKEKFSKPAGSDKYILPLVGIAFSLVFILPSLDFRFNWSSVPIYVKVIGFLILILSFYLLTRSMLENAYASKVLDIRQGQKLIDTGLYAHVRHPLYSGYSLLCIGVALGLGSWYALIPAMAFVGIIFIRCKFEEDMLIEGLEGYKEYKKRVKYRLIPYLL
ncbi:MAG: methyltransferase family protein [Promethearchaeota archaeon]